MTDHLTPDELIVCAVEKAATLLNRFAADGYRLLEAKKGREMTQIKTVKSTGKDDPCVFLQPAVRVALEGCGARVSFRAGPPKLPNWCPQPGGLDVQFFCPGHAVGVAELKVEKTDEVLWDLYKMVDAVVSGTASAASLVVAATDGQIKRRQDACRELFADGERVVPTATLFENNRTAWLKLLKGGSGRPTSVPASVRVRCLTNPALDIRRERRGAATAGKLWCIQVEGASESRVPFQTTWACGDWPLDICPDRAYVPWKRRHWRLAKRLADRGSMPRSEFRSEAKALGINIDKECGLDYDCEPMFTLNADHVRLGRTQGGPF